MDGGGAYQVKFVPEDGRPPTVLARTQTVAGAQSRFARHVAELRAAGERGRLVLVNTERRGRFAGKPIREMALTRSAAPWETRLPAEPTEPASAQATVVVAPMDHRSRPVAAATPRPSSRRWRFWERFGRRRGRAAPPLR